MFKQDIRELDLWCSSCMVAFEANEPVGVLIGCKRPPHTHVLRLAVHPDHLRRGHGRHMLTSLSAKLAILGPPTLLAEGPEGNAAAALFRACGWREAGTFVDFSCEEPPAAKAPAGLAAEVTVEELADIALPSADAGRSWARSRASLLNRRERLLGLALAGGEALDASVLYTRQEDNGIAIWSLTLAPGASGEAALGVLLRELAYREGGPVSIPRMGDDEAPVALLTRLGFTASTRTVRWTAQASA